ncbi:MAG: hypothetical protein JXA92_07710 [candidate division Zixibacteria bacterium]|nr:hypothetical protein [candidate division Zixibacteria bacterium]
MTTEDKNLDCYIGAVQNRSLDPYLEKNGFSRGLTTFAIPALGILFKCRVEGDPVELEFAAFFSLLKFISTSLAREKITALRVFSSLPEFVFSFTGKGKHLAQDSPKYKMLKQYSAKYTIAIRYIEKEKNRSLISPADYPSLPENQEVKLDFDLDEKKKINIKPFQKGIIL